MLDKTPACSVFISYSSEDRKNAEVICSSLEKRGLTCWIAPRDVRPGHEYGDEIIHGIESCPCFLILLSKAANASPFVIREVERAVSKKKIVFPVRLANLLPSKSLEFFLSSSHWTDVWQGNVKQNIDRLSVELAAAANFSPFVPKKRFELGKWTRRFVGSIALIVLIACLVWAVPPVVSKYWRLKPAGDSAKTAAVPNSLVKPRAKEQSAAEPAPEPVVEIPRQPQPPTSLPIKATARPKTLAGLSAKTIALLESYKQKALWWVRNGSNFYVDDWFASCDASNWWFAVKQISYGVDREQLDRSYEINQGPYDQSVPEATNSCYLNYIPILPWSKKCFIQLEFYDGTKSEIKPAILQNRSVNYFRGIRLSGEGEAGENSVPDLFVGTWIDGSPGKYRLSFIPAAPLGAFAASYSFDEEGFFKAKALGEDAAFKETLPSRGFVFNGEVKDTLVRILYKTKDGSTIGPFRYELKEASSLVLQGLKAHFLAADPVTRITSQRVAFTFPLLPADYPNTSAHASAMKIRLGQLERAGLDFITRAPVIACVPHRSVRNHDYEVWGAVREVRIGSQEHELEAVPVNLSVSNVIENSSISPESGPWKPADIWKTTLESDSKAVYVQYVFHDGTTTEICRLPITDFQEPK